MNRLITVLCSTLGLFVLAARGDEVSKAAKIEELLRVTNASQLLTQTMEQMKSAEVAQLSKIPVPPEARPQLQQVQEKVFGLIQARLSWDKMKPVYIKLYDDTFSEQELDGIIQFYRTPAGQALLQKMPLLMRRSMELTQGMIADLVPEIQKVTQDALKGVGPKQSQK
jgi:hypothetical protein